MQLLRKAWRPYGCVSPELWKLSHEWKLKSELISILIAIEFHLPQLMMFTLQMCIALFISLTAGGHSLCLTLASPKEVSQVNHSPASSSSKKQKLPNEMIYGAYMVCGLLAWRREKKFYLYEKS
jgi:hypothetical protein